MKTLIILLFAVVLLSSCERQSHRLPVTPTQKIKVVILDSASNNYSNTKRPMYKYKIKVLDQNVVSYINLANQYEVNDTLLVNNMSIGN